MALAVVEASITESETGALAGVALTEDSGEVTGTGGAEAAGGTPDGGDPADGITGDGMADGDGADLARYGGEAIHTLYSYR